MHPFRQARVSLAIRYFLLSVGTLVVISLVIVLIFNAGELREIDGQLLRQAAWLSEFAVNLHSDHELYEELYEISVAAHEPSGAIVYDSAGTIRLRHGILIRVDVPGGMVRSQPRSVPFTFSSADLGQLRAVAVSMPQPPGGMALLVSSMAGHRSGMERLILTLVLAGLAAAVMAAVLGWHFSGAALRPAQDAYKRMQEFLANASHELRTPLSAIVGEAEVTLRRPRDADEYRQSMQFCATYAQHMVRVVEAVLEISRADIGMPIPDAAVDLGDIAKREVESLARRFPDGPAVTCRVAPDALVRGDTDLLASVVRNLLENAVEHTPPTGEVTVTVSAVPGAGGVQLTVADNGEGIAPEHLPHIFERFYRADRPRSRSRGGIGLGLAIVEATVEAHGGSIDVESRPGVGSVFTVTFGDVPPQR